MAATLAASSFFTGQRLAPRSGSSMRVSRQQVVTQARTLEAGERLFRRPDGPLLPPNACPCASHQNGPSPPGNALRPGNLLPAAVPCWCAAALSASPVCKLRSPPPVRAQVLACLAPRQA